jgi:tetratricopeptide (TPR) repeat protein
VIMTRGLLATLGDQGELDTLLRRVTSLAGKGSPLPENRAAHEATLAILSQKESVYDPESGSITLARMLARRPCERDCLTGTPIPGRSRPGELPASVGALGALQPSYALVEEARQLEKADKPAQAINLYLQAATMTPDEPHLLGSLGTAYLRAGDLQAARLHLQKAVKLQPDYYRTRMGLGYLYLQQGEVRKANRELAESVRLLPVTENLFLLAEAREKGDDVAGGLSLYQLVVEKDPHSKLGRTAADRLARSKGAQ